MDIERLTKLRDFLRDHVQDDRFNLSTWAGTNDLPWGGLPDLSCGTVACACGWATTIPEFAEAGFKLIKGDDSRADISYDGAVHFKAASKFFDISYYEACYLFDPYEYDYSTREDVINRISQFIEDGESSS